jgi:PilZ domain-containing protein
MSKTRKHQRHIFEPPVTANYGAMAVRLLNISHSGLQLEHTTPLRLKAPSRIVIPLPRAGQAELQGEVLWSHLSRRPNPEGKLLYRSGVRVDETPENAALIERLVNSYSTRRDTSLDKKPEANEEGGPVVRPLRIVKQGVDPDRVLLIQQVAARLRQSPGEMKTHADRARSALSIKIDSVVHTDEVLAVWDYLQRLVTIDEVNQVLH